MMSKAIKKTICGIMVLVLLIGSTGCFKPNPIDEEFEDNDDFYTIKMYMMVNTASVPVDLKKVQNAINTILRDEINAQLDITAFVYTEYNSKMNTKVANYEEFDMLFTDFESYYRYLEMEALYPLDSLLERYGQDVYANFSDEIWNQARAKDGKIYAAINNQILPRSWGIEMRDSDYYKEFLTAEDITQEQIMQLSLTEKFDFLEDYMDWLAENKSGAGESTGGRTWGFEVPYYLESMGFDTLGMSMAVPGVVRADASGKPVVVNQFEQPEMLELVSRMAKWYQMGYIPQDVGDTTYNYLNCDVNPARTWKPGERFTFTQGGKQRVKESFQFGDPYYLSTYLLGTMWGISATSANPARTMKFINLMHSDARIHNLLKLGIEGDHYNIDENGQAVQTQNSARYNNEGVKWTFGNEFIGLTLNTQPKDLFEQVAEINESTPLTSVIGFNFDRSTITTKIQLCTEAATSMFASVNNGQITTANPNYYTNFLANIKSLGCDDIIAEKQRQLDIWWEAQN